MYLRTPYTKLIVRFDDVTSSMAWSKFLPLKKKLEGIGIKSVLGVVPECRDPNLCVEAEREDFFDLVRFWMNYGDTIAQHGTFHHYTTKNPGLLGINQQSEFSGLSESEQIHLLQTGKELLANENVWQPYFMAPSHSFDRATLRALKQCGFQACTDGYGVSPYQIEEITLVPQMLSRPFNIGFGVATICVHINAMSKYKIDWLSNFVSKNRKRFVDFKDVVQKPVSTGAIQSAMRWGSFHLLQLKRHKPRY